MNKKGPNEQEIHIRFIADVVTGNLDVRQAAADLAQESDEGSADGMDGARTGVHDDE